jgi:hypothetical protein
MNTVFTSSPRQDDLAYFNLDARDLIRTKMGAVPGMDPRKPVTIGDVVATCRDVKLSFRPRTTLQLPTGELLYLIAVYGQGSRGPATYLGNEVRLADGKVVAQRLRSPESAAEFYGAATPAQRHGRSAHLFLANWRDETVVDALTAKKMVVGSLPSDQPTRCALRCSWYIKEHTAGPGRVDLRAAFPELCAELDRLDAEATTADTILVSPEEMKALSVAVNLIDADDGVNRLRTALKAVGVRVPVQEGGASWKQVALQAARRCHVAEVVGV